MKRNCQSQQKQHFSMKYFSKYCFVIKLFKYVPDHECILDANGLNLQFITLTLYLKKTFSRTNHTYYKLKDKWHEKDDVSFSWLLELYLSIRIHNLKSV